MRRCEGMVDVVDEGTALSGNVAGHSLAQEVTPL
jgi:hypothetical protein